MYITIEVWPKRILVNIGSCNRTLWFDDWVMILESNLIRDTDKVNVSVVI